MSLHSNVSNVRCRRLASCRKRGGVDITKALKLGVNAKLKLSAADAVALINKVSITTSA